MDRIQRISNDRLEALREELKENKGFLKNSDIRKESKIPTKPRIFRLTTNVPRNNKTS